MRTDADWTGVALYALCLMPFVACTVAIRWRVRWRDMRPITSVLFELLLSVDVLVSLNIIARLIPRYTWFEVLRLVLVACVIVTGWRLFIEIRRIQTEPNGSVERRRSTDI